MFEGYEREGLIMPYTMKDFRRDFAKEHLKDLTPAERLEGLSPDERLQGLSPDQRLQGLSAREIEEYLKQHRPTGPAHKRKKMK